MTVADHTEDGSGPVLLAVQTSPRRRGFTAELMQILLRGARAVEDVTTEEDFRAGRQAGKPEDKYPQALEQSWDLLGMYLDNMTEGSGKKEDLLSTRGFEQGWFRYREAFRFFEESDGLFRRVIDLVEAGEREEALRVLARPASLPRRGA